LRFPGFEGEWENIPLNLIGDFIGGGTPSSANTSFWQGYIPWISSSDLDEDNINKINVTRYITKEAIDNSATKICQAPVILIVSRVGVGKVAYSKEDICTSQDFTNIISIKSNGLFLSYLLSKIMKLKAKETQGTSIKGITSGEIKSIKISIPKNKEQGKIATFLFLIDKRIETQNKIIEQYKSLIKGLSEKIFSKEMRFKDRAEINFPEWERKRLGDISIITTGSSNREDSILDGEFAFFDRSQYIRTSNQYLFDKEAIIIPGEGQEFSPKYYVGKFDLHQRTYAIFDFKESNGKFLYYHICSNNNYLMSQAVGSTVKSLRLPMFQSMPINLPCMEEQALIADFLSKVSDKIEIETRLLQQFDIQKEYLLQQVFIS
jgi:type I restriction enzyme S subunit